MKKTKRIVSLLTTAAVIASSITCFGISAAAEDNVMKASFERVQFSFAYEEGTDWSANTFASAKSGTPQVDKIGNLYGVHGKNNNDSVTLTYKPENDITGYEVVFSATTQDNLSGTNLNVSSNSLLYYSADDKNYTQLNGGGNYQREDTVDFYSGELKGDGTKPLQKGDVYKHVMTNKSRLPAGTKYFRVYSKGRNWKSTFNSIKLWGLYDGSDETSKELAAEMAFEKISNGQAADNIQSALSLPANAAGHELSWSSSDEAVINSATGAVTVPEYTQKVTITATTAYTAADGIDTKAQFDYELTVPGTKEPTASAKVYTFGSEQGLKTEAEIFDGVEMVSWTASRTVADNGTPMFEPYAQTMPDGTTAYTIKRKRNGGDYQNNYAGYVTYRIADMNTFDVSFILGNYNGKTPQAPTFEISADGESYKAHTEIAVNGAIPTEAGKHARVNYTGYNIPEGIKYLRINLPTPPDAAAAGFLCVQLEKVKINQRASLGEWANPNFEVNFDGAVAQLSWNELDSSENFEYEILQDGCYAASVPKGTTSYSLDGLDEHTEYQFAVAAVARNDDSLPNLSTNYISSRIMKSGGDEKVFADTFKFAETLSDYAVWSAGVVYNADNKTVQRAAVGNLSATYDIGTLISEFTADFMIYRGRATPGDSSFEVSADGTNFTAVTAVKTGNEPTNYTTVPWSYTVENVQAQMPGARFIRINFGAVAENRANGTQLKKITVTKASDEEINDVQTINKITAAMAWEALFAQEQNGITADLSLPQTVCEEGYAVSWSSDNQSVITDDGKIARGTGEQTARLSAEVSYGEGKTLSFGYDVVVLRNGVDSIMLDPCEDFSKVYEHSENIVMRDMTTDFDETGAFGIANKNLTTPEQEYIVYKLDGISGFDIRVAENDQGNVGRMRFEVAGADGVFTELDGVTKTTPETIVNQWKSAHYIANELPEDTQYLKMYFVTYVLSPTNKCWSFVIDRVSLLQTKADYAYEWQTDAAAVVSDITENSAAISWGSVDAQDGEAVYKVYVNGKLAATVDGTNLVIDNLDRNSVNSVYVRAVGKEDSAKISKKLTADDFRTLRKQGTPSEVNPDGSELKLSNHAGDVVSAKADIELTGDEATFGFKNADGTLGNAYVKIYPAKTEYYKNGTLAAVEKHANGSAFTVTTEDCWITADGASLFIDGAQWSNVVVYTTPASDAVYYTANSISGAQRIDLNPADMPLENLSKAFTFETNVTIPSSSESNFRLALYSKSGAKIAELTESKTFEHGKNGALYLMYANTPLYEEKTWLPRLEYDGVSRNLKLFIDPAAKTITAAIDDKVVGDGLCVTDVDAAELAYIETGDGYTLTDTVISGGYRGFAYKPLRLTDAAGNTVSRLNKGDKATLRLDVVNTVTDGAKVSLFARQDNAEGYIESVEAFDSVTANKEGWQTVEFDITAVSDDARIKAYAWSDAEGMKPITEPGGYFGAADNANSDKRLFLIGDSTVRYVYKTGQNPPNIGWGEVIGRFLNENMTVYNYAKDGTSSKTYWQSGRLNAMKPYMREGDYLMFQLGHNDRNPSGRPDKGTTAEEYKSYLRGYVAEARQLGLNMIFVTPVALQADITEDGEAKDPAKSSLYTYVTAMEAVAAELNVPIIDLFRTSISELHKAGVTSSDKKDIYTDGTHFTEAGAEILCGYIRDLLEANADTNLDEYFK